MPSPGDSLAHLPADIRHQLGRLTTACQAHFAGRLVGLYLHGSAASGGWQASASDLDLLLIVSFWRSADRPVMTALCLDLSAHPGHFELHVLTHRDLTPWEHPAAYRFHYSETWRGRISAGAPAPGTDVGMGARDRDLAAHLTTARARGLILCGRPVATAIPVVPRLHFIDSVFCDLQDSTVTSPGEGYEVLNLCRSWAFLTHGELLSKEEGGRWALSRLPADQAATVYQALVAHRDGGPEDPSRLSSFRRLLWPTLWASAHPAERAVIRRWWPATIPDLSRLEH
ncbi:MAG: aminoglycoside adenylyltransferase domain-containing protein [Sulfobacillus sp.]